MYQIDKYLTVKKVKFNVPLDMTGHLREESSQAINCTGTDDWTHNNQRKIHTRKLNKNLNLRQTYFSWEKHAKTHREKRKPTGPSKNFSFAVGLAANPILAKKTRIFWHCSMDLCRARRTKLQITKALTAAMSKQFMKNASGYLQPACLITITVTAHYLANCVYSCVCWVVEEYDLMFSVVLIWKSPNFGIDFRPGLEKT